MTPRDLLLAWTWRPGVAVALAAAIGTHVAWLRPAPRRRMLALLGASAAVVLALMSPIDALARGTLFSAHMLQHMLLARRAAGALLALPAIRPATPPRRTPAIAMWALGVGAMWIWHAPLLCSAAATSDPVRALQTISLPALGAAFWWPVVGPTSRLPELTLIAYLFTACVACSILGIAIRLFSPVTVCAAYAGMVPIPWARCPSCAHGA